jgi:hypothetical protein
MNFRSRFTLFAATLACIASVTTGCSKNAAVPSVAQLTTAAAITAPSAAGSAAPNNSAAPTGAAGLLAYSECMRSHGVPDFPDPVGNSLQIKGGPGSDLDPDSPQMQTAQKACESLAPGGGEKGTVSAAQQARGLKFSACMREHGVPNFPDPTFSGGGVQLHVTGIDPNSPQMIAAQNACQTLQPGGGDISEGQSGQGAAGAGS